MTTRFDAIIVGAGQAGPPLAGRLTAAGQTVAVIERKLVGGTCVNYGCIPTKTLVASAHTAHAARRGAEYGIGTGDVTVDMAKVKARKDKIMLGRPPRRRVLARGHGRVHPDPRPRPLRGPAHHPGRRPGAARPTGSSSTSAAARSSPTSRASTTSTTSPTSASSTSTSLPEHLVIIGGSYIGAGVRADVPPLRRPGQRRREGPAGDLARGRGRLRRDPGDPGGRGHRRPRRRDRHANRQARQRFRRSTCTRATAPTRSRARHLLVATGRQPNTDDLGLDARGSRDRRARLRQGRRPAAHHRRRTSGRWGTATARAPSPTPRTTTSRSSPPTCSTTIRAGSATASPTYALYIDPPLGRAGHDGRRGAHVGPQGAGGQAADDEGGPRGGEG